MKKIYSIVLLIIVLMTGCNQEPALSSSADNSIPLIIEDNPATETINDNPTIETMDDNPIKDDSPDQENTLVSYSNLLAEAVKTETFNRLVRSGIPESNVVKVMEWVDAYNDKMNGAEGVSLMADFTEMEGLFVKRVYYSYAKEWKFVNYMDVLCRTTAFALYKDYISAADPIPESRWAMKNDNELLYSDWECFSTNSQVGFTKEEQAVYYTLFNPVAITKADTDTTDYFHAIKKEWNARGISIDDAGLSASMFTVWFKDEDAMEVSIGHIGILIEDEEGLLFFEKTNPQQPYQVTKFHSKEQLKEYLLKTFEAEYAWLELETPKLFFMINDELI